MTSATKTSDSSAGFTLIEIVMVLAIATIVSGGAISFLVFSADERDLRKTSVEIESLARRARTTAILQQTPYALEFTPGQIRLLPFAEAGHPSQKKEASTPRDQRKTPLPPSNEVTTHLPTYDRFSPSSEMAVLIRHWNSDDWLPMKENKPQVWRFDPDGLSEPISVRLELGKSWCQDAYHPLNATISDSQFEIK
jgi:prepilin-type N-terminal cleavage/methylation domain-containing protein